MKLLTIIVPFHNSAQKCDRLLASLRKCEDQDVELILVDDGSTDNTLAALNRFKSAANCAVKIISQENKGPGGARNTGLIAAKGHYLWFVDSDDDIRLDLALAVLRSNLDEDPDFIDFNLESSGNSINSMAVEPGHYKARQQDITLLLAKQFGRIWSKIFHHRVFKHTGVRYPEYCIYEDNPLLFILPFCANTFVKSDQCVYIHHEDHESVTRGKRSDRYWDRMRTAVWGYNTGKDLIQTSEEAKLFKNHLIFLYLINTGQITKKPSSFWLEKMRIMRQFKGDMKRLGVVVRLGESFALMPNSSWKYKFAFAILYLISSGLPSQDAYFMKKRLAAWGRPFDTRSISVQLPV